jgi:hypothetical protein
MLNQLKYSVDFQNLVNESHSKSLLFEKTKTPNPYYIGYGNPNAKILIIGKEKGFDINDKDVLLRESTLNPKQWKAKIEGDIPKLEFDPETPYGVEMNNLPEGHTWSKYNKLNNYIFGTDSFKQNTFISELNFMPSKYSPGRKAIKENITLRLNFFEHSYFKNQFSVVLLACSSYIKPHQIYANFNCQYAETKNFGIGNKYYLHYNENKSRLIVHTRQLSMNVKNEMLKNLAEDIHKHLKK